MSKTKPATKKVVIEKVATVPVETKPVEAKYHAVIKFNDQVFDFYTDDLAQSITDIKPVFLKTRVLFNITQGDKSCERMLLLNLAKMMWRNKFAMEAFVSRLIFV